jgi:DNA polymerase-3 subunit gamma/tau
LAKLTEAARDFFGHEFQWVVRAKASPPSEEKGSQKSKSAKGSTRRSIMEHPQVLQALEVLGGELVDIRPLKTGRPEAHKSDTPSESQDGPELL